MELQEQAHQNNEQNIEDVRDLHEAVRHNISSSDFIGVVELYELVSGV